MDIIIRTPEERIAALEAKYDIMEDYFKDIDQKLDSIIALKNKGAGAFWLISALFGTSLIMAIEYVLGFLKGPPH